MVVKYKSKLTGWNIFLIIFLLLGLGAVLIFLTITFVLPLLESYYDKGGIVEKVDYYNELFPVEKLQFVTVTPDQKNIAYVIDDKAGDFVVLNQKIQPYLWEEVESSFTLSEDGEHLAYIASKESEYYVVKDGNYYGPYNSYIKGSEEIMSSNGEHFGVGVTKKNGKDYILMNGNLTEEDYCCIANTSPIFSKDGTRWSYGVKEREDSGKWSILIDGKTFTYPQIGSFGDDQQESLFSPNSQNYMFVVLEDEDTQYVVYNGFSEEKYHAVRDLTFSPDGKHYAYTAVTESGPGEYSNRVVYNGKELASEYMISDIYFTPDSTHLLYTAYLDEKRDKMKLVTEIDEGEIIDNTIINLALSSDGEKVAYVNSTDNGKYQVVFDGERFGEYDDILGDISISPNENKVLYIAKKGDKNILLVNNEEISAADQDVWYAGWNNLGEYWYVVKNEEKYETSYEIYVGDEIIDKGGEVSSFAFTDSGEHYAYVMEELENESETVVVDGKVIDTCVKVFINEKYSLFDESDELSVNYFCLEEVYVDTEFAFNGQYPIKSKRYIVEDN